MAGRIGLTPYLLFDRHWNPNHRWDSEGGQEAIESSIQAGDAHIRTFEPGEMLKAPTGTLHRKNISVDEQGFRYFIRQYPKVDVFRQGAFAGRIRPN